MGLNAKFSTGRWARRTCRTAALWLEFTRTVSGTVEDAAGDAEEAAGDQEEVADCTAEAVCGREVGGRIGPEERDDCGAPGAETM